MLEVAHTRRGDGSGKSSRRLKSEPSKNKALPKGGDSPPLRGAAPQTPSGGAKLNLATSPRQLAVATTHAEVVAALRARAEQLQWSRQALDGIAGLTDGYAAKMLAPVPIKGLGPQTLGPILGAMGLVIIVAEDPKLLAAARRIAEAKGWGERDSSQARDGHLPTNCVPTKGRRGNPMLQDPVLAVEFNRRMRARATAKMTKAQRSKAARHASRCRWAKVRAAKKAARALPPVERKPKS